MYSAIQKLHADKGYPILLLCKLGRISRAAYYKWKNRIPGQREALNIELSNKIRKLYSDYKGILGYRRISMYLNRDSLQRYNRKRIYRIMRVLGLKSVIRRKRPRYMRSSLQVIAENLLNRNFTANSINEKWLTDVTELKYGSGQKAYLSAILDLKDRRIVSYILGRSNNNALVFKTLDQAVDSNPGVQPLLHSDRGYQYTSKVFATKIKEANITHSMSRVCRCIDNGPMEGFWGILKSEMYYLSQFPTYQSLQRAIDEYIRFYQLHRLQEGLHCMALMEYHKSLSESVG